MFRAGDKRSYYYTDYGYSLSGDLCLGCRLHLGHYQTHHLIEDAPDAMMNDSVTLNRTLLSKTNIKAQSAQLRPELSYWKTAVSKIFVCYFHSYTIMFSLSNYHLWIPGLVGN